MNDQLPPSALPWIHLAEQVVVSVAATALIATLIATLFMVWMWKRINKRHRY